MIGKEKNFDNLKKNTNTKHLEIFFVHETFSQIKQTQWIFVLMWQILMFVQSRQISHPSGPHLSVTPDIPSTSSGFYSNTSSQRESPTNTGSTPGTPGPIRFHLGRQHPQNSPGLIQTRVSGIILICKCQRLESVFVDS